MAGARIAIRSYLLTGPEQGGKAIAGWIGRVGHNQAGQQISISYVLAGLC